MDLSEFYSGNTDIKKWINKSLQSGRAPTDSLSDHLKHLIGELRYQYDSKDHEFEKASESALSSVPTILCEIERVSTESKKVQSQIERFYISLAKIEKESSDSINLLAEIDKVKDRMKSCMLSLRSADTLLKSNNKLEELRSSENVQEIAKQIQLTKENLAILGDLPQFSGTKNQLVQLQNRLEGMARPLLSNALENRNSEDVKMLIGLFQQMERTQELQEYFFEFYTQKTILLWKKLTDSIQNQSGTFSKFLSEFYGEFSYLLDNDVRWASKLLPVEYSFPIRLVGRAMSKIEASYKSFLEQLSETGDDSTRKLQEIWEVAKQFANQSLEAIGNLQESQKQNLLESIFAPFRPLQLNFFQVISKRLHFELQKSILIKPTNFSQTITTMEERIPKIFHLCEETTNECLALTGGVQVKGFINALSDVFVKFLENCLEILQFLRVESKVDIKENNPSITETIPAYEQTFSHDWTFVQGALQVLHSSNIFSRKLNAFESFLRNKFISQGNILQNDSSQSADLIYFRSQIQQESSEFSKFLERLSDVGYKLLPTPHRMFVTYDTRIQTFVFDTMFQFIKEKLETVPKLKNWEKSAQISPAGIEMPMFSLSQLGYITQIGEHLFALPQQLAPFASGELDTEEKDTTSDDDIDTGFVSQWLQHISSNTMSLYLQKICQIQKLSTMGVKQLITDIEYLCEVISPFGIQPEASLQTCLDFLRASEDEFVELLQSIPDQTATKIGTAIGKMRSIPLPSNLKESQ